MENRDFKINLSFHIIIINNYSVQCFFLMLLVLHELFSHVSLVLIRAAIVQPFPEDFVTLIFYYLEMCSETE